MTALDKRQQLIDLLKQAHQITQEVDSLTAGYQIVAALHELNVHLNEHGQQDAPIDETPYDLLTGEIFSTMHGLPIEEDGPETLEGIRLEAPYMENEWRVVRKTLETITLEQIDELRTIKRRGQLHVVK